MKKLFGTDMLFFTSPLRGEVASVSEREEVIAEGKPSVTPTLRASQLLALSRSPLKGEQKCFV